MTIKNEKLLLNILLEFLHHQLISRSKRGVLVQFDGSLTSLVNYQIAKLIQPDIQINCLATLFNQNKFNIVNITSVSELISTPVELFDATNYPIPFQDRSLSSKKRISDMIFNIKADQEELLVLGNLCYTQWCVNFPDASYKNPEHIFLLNRLYYSEIQQLAQFLKIPNNIINRKIILDYEQGKTEKDFLGFSFQELDSFLSHNLEIKSLGDATIAQRLITNARFADFLCPTFQRPCNFLI